MRELNNLLASFTLLTRLPFWRLKPVPKESFAHVVDYWPLVGWLTGGVAAAVIWCAGGVLPKMTAVVLALSVRVLLTGALHEDGLADFFDGFGGGRDRERTLAIMKDSRIGSYGVLGLILYYLSLVSLLSSLAPAQAAVAVLAGDPLAKWIASQQVNLLPYARTAAESKVGVVYRRMSPVAWCVSAAAGLLPVVLWLPSEWWGAVLFPVFMLVLLAAMMRRRIGGYTGDCCGAVFLLCEWAFYLGIRIVE